MPKAKRPRALAKRSTKTRAVSSASNPRKPPAPGAHARRLRDLKAFLIASEGASIYEIAEHFGMSARTALRQVQTLEAQREPIYEEKVGQHKVWHIAAEPERGRGFSLTQAQMVALTLGRGVFDFLAGTGFDDDLKEVFDRLDRKLQADGRSDTERLARKLFVISDAPQIYKGAVDVLNDIVTALLREQHLRLRHPRIDRGRPVLFDPYTLAVYKRGLYLIGHSHHHDQIRTLAVEQLVEVEWLRGHRFRYPADYHPSQVLAGAFGLIPGPKTEVRIFFTSKVAKFIRRRQWHPTQQIRRVDGGIELTMEPAGTTELVSWVLQWGDQAELLAPAALRDQIAGEVSRMTETYGRPPPPALQMSLLPDDA